MSLSLRALALAVVFLGACGYREVERPAPRAAATPSSTASAQAPVAPATPEPDRPAGLASTGRSLCVRFTSGKVRCLGWGGDGDQGRGLTQCITGAGEVSGLTDAIDLAAGTTYYCARRADGSVTCWGNHYRFRYDRDEPIPGGPEMRNAVPIRLANVRNVESIALSSIADQEDSLCTLESNPPTMRCIRDPYFGSNPVTMSVVGARALRILGESSACALGEGDTLRCSQRRGDAIRTTDLSGVVDADGRGSYGCVARASGKVECGATGESFALREVPGAADVVDVAVGGSFACGRTRDGHVDCWGPGFIPDGRLDGSTRATRVADLADVAEIVAGDQFACARRQDGEVRCWGALGDGSKPVTGLDDPEALAREPVEVAGVTGATQVVGSTTYSCAIVAGGAVTCWGAVPTAHGRTIDPTPHAIPNLRGITALATSTKSFCGTNGTDITCVGDPATFEEVRARLGLTTGAEERFPVTGRQMSAPTPPDVTGVTLGAAFGCGIGADGIGTCWGSNSRGQLGRNLRRDYRPEAVAVFSAGRLVDLGAGPEHVCAVRRDGTVACWGDDRYGQLGQGTVRLTRAPTAVRFDAPCVEGPIDPAPR